MLKQGSKNLIITTIITIVMLSIIKNLFAQSDNNNILKEALKSDSTFLVDVRTPAEFASGSVPKAINIPLDSIPKRINEFKNRQTIVVFCRSGNRSSQAEDILLRSGIQNIINGGSWTNVNALILKISQEP